MEEKSVSIKVELAGGLDILFANCPKLDVTIPATGERSPELDSAGQSRPSITVSTLIEHLSEKVMKDSRKDLFVVNGQIRPGIMVLINEVDWELEGEEECELVNGDEVLFVSTLHGG